jgi:hypothetical protein
MKTLTVTLKTKTKNNNNNNNLLKGSPNLLQETEYLSHSPPFNSNYYSSIGPSLVSPHKADPPSQGR